MRIIIAPAKKMVVDTDSFAVDGLPVFLEQTERLKAALQGMSPAELQALWKCNDAIAKLNGLVIVFMIGQGYFVEPVIGLFGAFCGCIVSTRLMQRFIIKAYPNYAIEDAIEKEADTIEEEVEHVETKSVFIRVLNSLLDGGRTGVDVGIAIIPGVLIISTFVMILTFGASAEGYTGAAYEGIELLPWLAGKINFIFEWLFGFSDPHLVAFPITALGAVGAALGLVPNFASQGWIDGNAIAVFTAIGMCWSGYLSTHTAMLDSLGYRELTPKAILAHTIGGIVAAFVAHMMYVLVTML